MPASPASTAPATVTSTYPGNPSQIRVIRADLRALLNDCPRADDIVLCASELAANAVVHSDSARPGGVITVRVAVRVGCHVHIEVSDSGGPWSALRRATARDPERPHGLDMIAALAAAWGIDESATGRAVWAHLHWDAE